MTASAEILDTSLQDPVWTATGSLDIPRDNLNMTLLADGNVLAVGGGDKANMLHMDPVKQTEMYNVGTGTWSLMATQMAERAYHSTAVLLPDGRVLSGGDDSGMPEEHTVELYSPPYLFHGPRPTITSLSGTELTYGDALTINTPDAANIQRVALVRPGAVTHSDNMDQRYIDLPFQTAARSSARRCRSTTTRRLPATTWS